MSLCQGIQYSVSKAMSLEIKSKIKILKQVTDLHKGGKDLVSVSVL